MLATVRLGSTTTSKLSVADVDFLAADDGWAVGTDFHPPQGKRGAFAEHWDGDAWTLVDVAQVGIKGTELSAVSATGPNDAWAVGYYDDGRPSVRHQLVEHWDGSSWQQVPIPSGTGRSEPAGLLEDVVAVAPDDVWAVGDGDPGPVEHWDGSSWQQIALPAGVLEPDFGAVDATSASDVWVTGSRFKDFGETVLYALHWDGSTWSSQRLPRGRPAHVQAALRSVLEVSPTDVWASGYLVVEDDCTEYSILLHWDGVSWRQVHPPHAGCSLGWALDASGPSDVWYTVGTRKEGAPHNTLSAVEHWNGTDWRKMRLPDALQGLDPVSVSALAPDDVWIANGGSGIAAGNTFGRWDGSQWTVVPGP